MRSREAEHDVHVVLDDQDRDLGGQRRDRVEDQVALGRGHAGRGLVEQQDLGAGGEREGDLDQALAAVGQRRDRLQRLLVEPEIASAARRPRRTAPRSVPSGRQKRRLEPVRSPSASATLSTTLELRNSWLIWKVRARPRRARACCGRRVTSRPSRKTWPADGRERAADQVEQRGLAGAVRADQRLAAAARELEVDVRGHGEAAEALVQPARRERRRGHGAAGIRPPRQRASARSSRPSRPPRQNSTTSTSTRPMPNCQNSGLMRARWSSRR